MLRTFCGTRHTSPKSNLTKEKRLPRQTSEKKLSLAEADVTNNPEGKGIEPLPLAGRVRFRTRASVTLPLNGWVSRYTSQRRPPGLAWSASRASWLKYAKNAGD